MKSQQLVLATTLFSAALSAQTIPKGWDTTEGIEVHTSAASQFWGGFDLGATVNRYNPSRCMHMYDSSCFPWNVANGTVISQLSFRRDGDPTIGTATAHDKEVVIILSTNDNLIPAQANFNLFDGNHGPNRTVVFGQIGTPKVVSFPATPLPATGTAPFDVVCQLNAPFVVPPNAKALVVEIRTYNVTGSTTGWWRTDSVTYDGAGYDGGSFATLNSNHCVTPSILFTSRAMTIGSNFGHIWRPSQAPGGKTVLTWIGQGQTTPYFLFPGSPACSVHVYPVWAILGSTSETSGSYAAYVDWGTVPFNPAFIGLSVDHQSMFVDATYPGGVGLTRGGTSTVGSGYDPAVCKGSQIYSYGDASSSRYVPVVDPDLEVHSRWLYRRHIIVKIN